MILIIYIFLLNINVKVYSISCYEGGCRNLNSQDGESLCKYDVLNVIDVADVCMAYYGQCGEDEFVNWYCSDEEIEFKQYKVFFSSLSANECEAYGNDRNIEPSHKFCCSTNNCNTGTNFINYSMQNVYPKKCYEGNCPQLITENDAASCLTNLKITPTNSDQACSTFETTCSYVESYYGCTQDDVSNQRKRTIFLSIHPSYCEGKFHVLCGESNLSNSPVNFMEILKSTESPTTFTLKPTTKSPTKFPTSESPTTQSPTGIGATCFVGVCKGITKQSTPTQIAACESNLIETPTNGSRCITWVEGCYNSNSNVCTKEEMLNRTNFVFFGKWSPSSSDWCPNGQLNLTEDVRVIFPSTIEYINCCNETNCNSIENLIAASSDVTLKPTRRPTTSKPTKYPTSPTTLNPTFSPTSKPKSTLSSDAQSSFNISKKLHIVLFLFFYIRSSSK